MCCVIISTHSRAVLQNIADAEILLIESGENGSTIRPPNEDEQRRMTYGLTPAEVLLPKTAPQQVQQLGLFA